MADEDISRTLRAVVTGYQCEKEVADIVHYRDSGGSEYTQSSLSKVNT